MNLVPLAIAEVERRRGFEDGGDRTAAVVHREGDGALNHLKDQVVSPALGKAFKSCPF